MKKFTRALVAFAFVAALLAGMTSNTYARTIEVTDGPALDMVCNGPCPDGAEIISNTPVGDGDNAVAWVVDDQNDTSSNNSVTEGDNTPASDYGDDNECNGGACGHPADGPDSYTNGTRLNPDWLASGQTGVTKVAVSWHVRVPESYSMNFDAFACSVPDMNIENASGCHVAKLGPWEGDVVLTDGAIGIVSERIAEDNLCHRYNENKGRARDFVITPKSWGHDPCGVNGSDNTGDGALTPGDENADNSNSNNGDNSDDGNSINDGNNGGSNASATPADADAGDSSTVDGKTRCNTTCGGDPQTFAAGDAVLGSAIDLNDDGVNDCEGGNCYYSSAPAGGKVYGGVVHPWKTEVNNLNDLSKG